MQQKKVLSILQAHKQELAEKYGVTRLGIFGSVARGESTDTSDIDVVVEMPPDLFYMVHLKEELEQLLASSVDLIRYQKYLSTLLRRRAEIIFDVCQNKLEGSKRAVRGMQGN